MSDSVYWDQGTRGWIANIARAELWRVPSWYSLDDLIQDGAMCFCKCLKTYATNPPSKTFVDEKGIERTLDGHAVAYVAPGKLPTDLQRQHFMALVRTAFTNHINTLSSRRTASCDEVLVSQISDVDSPDPLAAFAPLLEPDAPLFAAIKQAPAELAELIVKLTQDGFEAGTYLRTRLRHRGERVQLGRVGLRETTREHWDRVLGEIGVVDRVTDFITS